MRVRIILVLVLLFSPLLLSQSATGSLRGTVIDSSGARLPLATIRIHLQDSSIQRTTSGNSRGEFRIDGLAPGTYSVAVDAGGFSPAQAKITVELNTTRDLTVRMTPAPVVQSAEVRAQASSITTMGIDLSSQVHRAVITSRDLANLPLAARTFAGISYLAPGTEPVEPSDPTKARITAVSTGGSSGLNNDLSVDGGDDTDDYIGGFLQNVSPEAIQEFSFSTAQEDAETGATTGGSVIIRTRSGSNLWHGGGAFFIRAAALNARFPIENPAPDPKQPFSRGDYVATLGGPVRHDQLWFFTSFEHVHENSSIAYSPQSLVQFDALSALAVQGMIPGVSSIDVPRIVAIPFRDSFGSLRLDWKQSDRSAWFLRPAVDTYLTRNDRVQQATLPSTGLLSHNNYLSLVLGNQYVFSQRWLGRLVFSAGSLHLTQSRNSNLGFALAFPFSSTALTVSGFETFGDNQFATPITAFPSERNQQKYQLRYDLNYARAANDWQFGVNLIHEPVLGGAFPDNSESLYQLPHNPDYYIANPDQFGSDLDAGASTSDLDGDFQQNVQRLAVYAKDAWRITPRTTLNLGFRYSTTFALFQASGRSQLENPAWSTLRALGIPLVPGAPHDDRKQVAPRVGVTYALRSRHPVVLRGGFALYYSDLAQNGWVRAFQAVNTPPSPCVDPLQAPSGTPGSGCIPGAALGGEGNLIASDYSTPYAIHITGGMEIALGERWKLSADYTHEQGNHAYRGYTYTGGTDLFTPLLPESDPDQENVVPTINVARSDNRSSYNALLLHLQGNATRRFHLVANYTFSNAQTWGCVLGELFDYVNGVCSPLNPFGPGDYGPSGEDVRHRFVLAGTAHMPGGIELGTLTQIESARPYTITTADNSGRISINGNPTSLDQFRGTPYMQVDLRISRPLRCGEHCAWIPFVEFFNLFNRNNAGQNFVANVAALPVPADQAESGNITAICADPDCTSVEPVTKPGQLRIPAGALGDFFGPGTTVGIPFAAQLGLRFDF